MKRLIALLPADMASMTRLVELAADERGKEIIYKNRVYPNWVYFVFVFFEYCGLSDRGR